MARLRKLVRKALISAGSLAVVFVVAEVITRALEPGQFSFFDRNPYVGLTGEDGVQRHRPGFSGRWDGTWYEINSLGLRGPQIAAADPGHEYRVVTLGDSCTFGKGVREEDSWPRQLERTLAAELGTQERVVVANLGVNGYSGRDYERMFRDVGVGLAPDLVVVGYNLNDFPNAIEAVDKFVFQNRASRRLISQELRDLMGRTGVYRWLRQAYYHSKRESDWRRAEQFAKEARPSPADAEVWQRQVGYLESIRDQAAQVGAEMAVFLFPYESQVYLDVFDPTPIERLRATCADLGVPFVDLTGEFRREARSFDPPRPLFLKGDRYHPNREGYRIVAEGVARLITELGWLPEGD